MLTLRTLGSLNLLDSDGNELTAILSQPKRYALLVYLAVSRPGELHRRDSLLLLFWPELDERRARGSLSQALSYLRRHVSNDILITRGAEEVGLNASMLEVDAVGFRVAVRSGSWDKAVELYSGDFLRGFHVRGAAGFDEWMSGERDRLKTAATNAAWSLAHDQVRRGAFAEGERTASWAIDLACPDETTARRFVQTLAAAGDRVAALRFLRRYETVLEEALDLPPSQALASLAEALRSAEPSRAEAFHVGELLARGAPGAGASGPLPFTSGARAGQASDGRGIRFAGREEELSRLHQLLDRALKGDGTAAFVTGEAGTGKSVLSREFCTRSLDAHPDLVAVTGCCDAHTGVGDAYRPFREILRLLTGDVEEAWRAGSISTEHAGRLWSVLPSATDAIVDVGRDLLDTLVMSRGLADRVAAHGPEGVELAARVYALADARPPPSNGPLQSKLFDQFGRVLRRIARKRPILLILEDLQWADSGSLDLLFQLGRHLDGSRIVVLGLYRPSEVLLGRNGERHPLLKAVTEFRMAHGRREVALVEDGDRPFLEAVIDSEPNALGTEFREALFRLTRGHALFTVELLRQLKDERRIRQDGAGRWEEAAEIRWDVLPDKIEAVMEERTSRLSETLQRLLSIASVEGERFALEVVSGVMGAEPAALLALVGEELEKRHRLVELEEIGRIDGRRLTLFRFRHILFQQFLYAGLNQAERVLLHEEVGRALERLYGERSERNALELARHFREAGLARKAVDYLILASAWARRASAHREGMDHLKEALGLLSTLTESTERDRLELEVLSRLSKMSWVTGLYDSESKSRLVRFRDLAERLHDDDSRFWIACCEMLRHHYQDEHERARKDLDEAEAVASASGNPSQLVVANSLRGINALNLGCAPEVAAHLDAAEALYDPLRDRRLMSEWFPDLVPYARGLKALAVGTMGYRERADALVREAHAALLAPEVDWSAKLTVCSFDLCLRFVQRDLEAARRARDLLEPVAREFGQSGYLALCELWHGWWVAEREDPERGCRMMRAALETMDLLGWAIWRPFYVALLAESLARNGQAEEALRLVDEAVAWIERKGGREPEAEVHRIRGEALLSLPEPDPVSAESAFRKAVAVAEEQEAKLFQLRATSSLARLLRQQDRVEEAREALGACYAWFTEGFDSPSLVEARTLLEELG